MNTGGKCCQCDATVGEFASIGVGGGVCAGCDVYEKAEGFRCPQCGGECWGSFADPNGIAMGRCHGHVGESGVGNGDGCGFVWERAADDKVGLA